MNKKTREERLFKEYVKNSIVLSESTNAAHVVNTPFTNEKLIRQHIRMVIKEEFASGVVGADSPFGVTFGGNLLKTFVGPFVDAYKIGVAGAKKLSISTQTMMKVAVGTVLSTLIPTISKRYGKIFDEEKKKLDAVKQQYKDVYDRVDSSFKNGDAALLAFMASPTTFLTYMGTKLAAKTAKQETIHLLSAITGGVSDDLIKKASQKSKEFGRWLIDGSITGTPEEKSSKEIKFKKLFEEVIVKPSVEQAKPKLEEMKKVSKEIYESALNKAYEQAKSVLMAKTVEDVEKFLGSDMDQKTKVEIEKIKKMPQKEKEAAVKAIIDANKSFFMQPLKDKIDELKAQGQSENSDQIAAYKKTVQKIEAL